MKYINLVTREVVETQETMYCIPLRSFNEMLEYTPTTEDAEEFERRIKQ